MDSMGTLLFVASVAFVLFVGLVVGRLVFRYVMRRFATTTTTWDYTPAEGEEVDRLLHEGEWVNSIPLEDVSASTALMHLHGRCAHVAFVEELSDDLLVRADAASQAVHGVSYFEFIHAGLSELVSEDEA